MITKIIIGLFVGIGLFMILADHFRIPYMRTSKAVSNLAKQQKDKTSSIDVWLSSFASFIARHLKLNEYKKQQLEMDLRTAQMNISPEMFMANAIVKSLIIAVFAIPVLFIFPILSPIILILSFIMYRMNMKSVANRIKKKRTAIEYELPRLVFKIEKTLSHDKNIIGMLETYMHSAGPELKHELEITVADMRSGNAEVAITRLESRVGSPLMSDVCRGLISLSRGDVNTVYWSSLAMKFADIQRQQLKLQAEKIPKKVKKLSMCLLICFLMMYLVVILAQIINSIGVLFG
ncbi:MAG: secretion protein F [Acutalibacteraceae bacterium]|nr:secretion protein F [Acutalibacteraceae bacterium]